MPPGHRSFRQHQKFLYSFSSLRIKIVCFSCSYNEQSLSIRCPIFASPRSVAICLTSEARIRLNTHPNALRLTVFPIDDHDSFHGIGNPFVGKQVGGEVHSRHGAHQAQEGRSHQKENRLVGQRTNGQVHCRRSNHSAMSCGMKGVKV